MFKKMWEEIPTAFKVLWISGAVISAGFTGFIAMSLLLRANVLYQ